MLQNTSRQQETRAVGRSVVGEANLHAVLGQLMRVGTAHNPVPVDRRIRNLRNDVAVRDPNDKSILGGVVLVVVLVDETTSRVIVGFAASSAFELDLKSLKVRLILYYLDEVLHFHGGQ